jgi:ribose transport system substrate-binding protein
MLRSKKAVAAVAVLAALTAVAGCGSVESSSSSAADSGGSCGAVPSHTPADPDGVLAKFPSSVQKAYNLYPGTIRASAWASWKPTHPGPYTIDVNPGSLQNPFAQEFLAELRRQAGNSVQVVVKDPNNNSQVQIQQFQQTIQQKPDLMIVFLISPAADAPVLDEAGKAGIPVIAPIAASSSPYVIGIDGNMPLKGADLAQGLMSVVGGKGSLLEMQGVPGTQANDSVYQGVHAVLDGCPDAKIAGSPVGFHDPATAKTQTLQFLSAHPQPIHGAFQVGGMASAMIQAFQQTGRTPPPIADLGASPGALAYWNEHKGSYKGVALALSSVGIADATWNIASGLLAGHGIKINEILQEPVMVTDANLSQWVRPEWNLQTPLAYAPAPADAYYGNSYVNQFFSTQGK